MADTCAGDGAATCSPPKSFFSMDNKFLYTVLLQALVFVPLIRYLYPLLWRTAGSLLGWYLRKKTEGRRCHILELVEADEKEYRESRSNRTSTGGENGEDGEWEKVDAYTTGTSKNGDNGGGDDGWDGIVGFFHPFW